MCCWYICVVDIYVLLIYMCCWYICVVDIYVLLIYMCCSLCCRVLQGVEVSCSVCCSVLQCVAVCMRVCIWDAHSGTHSVWRQGCWWQLSRRQRNTQGGGEGRTNTLGGVEIGESRQKKRGGEVGRGFK